MPVDEMSLAVGRLEAVAAELSQQCRALFSKSDESTAQLHTVATAVERLAEDVRDLKQEVTDLRRTRDRGLGVLTGLSLVSGGVGAGAAKLLGLFGGSAPGH